MAIEVIVPKVDMVMETGTFVEWLKAEGDRVEKGEPLFIILTDKANIEVEAPASGVLAGLRAKPDDVIPVAQTIAYILQPGEALPGEVTPAATVPTLAKAAPDVLPLEEVQEQPATPDRPHPGNGKVRATPAARHMAADLGIDLALLSGRGPLGRIHIADVRAFAEEQAAENRAQAEPVVTALQEPPIRVAPAALKEQLPLPPARLKEKIRLAGPRKIIAERLAYSAFTAPHITLSLSVDMSEASRLRARLQGSIEQKTGQRLSFTAIIARAVAAVLPRHPALNASLQDEYIHLWDDVHLGIAMSLEDYLIVPVIQEAQSKSLVQLVGALGDLIERARAKRLTPAEMSGSTFTISNLGMFGIESFTAIINPPESAILAVGKMAETPVKGENGIEFRPLMNMTIAVDHRIVDGAAAARFLAELKEALENPYLLI